MKKIIWVDDSVSRMTGVVTQLFPRLWAKNIITVLVFLGDNFKPKGSLRLITKETLDYLQRDLDDQFRIFCDRQLKRRKSETQSESISLDQVYTDNSALQPQRPIDLNKKSGDILSIIAKITELTKGYDAYIGLDIQLYSGDDKIDKETQAMRLFHDLSECMNDNDSILKVFLYTSDEDLDDWKDRWFDKVKEEFRDFNPMPEKIFRRDDLLDNNLKPNEEKEEFYVFLGVSNDNEDNK